MYIWWMNKICFWFCYIKIKPLTKYNSWRSAYFQCFISISIYYAVVLELLNTWTVLQKCYSDTVFLLSSYAPFFFSCWARWYDFNAVDGFWTVFSIFTLLHICYKKIKYKKVLLIFKCTYFIMFSISITCITCDFIKSTKIIRSRHILIPSLYLYKNEIIYRLDHRRLQQFLFSFLFYL